MPPSGEGRLASARCTAQKNTLIVTWQRDGMKIKAKCENCGAVYVKSNGRTRYCEACRKTSANRRMQAYRARKRLEDNRNE